jgi:DNA-binding PadR family transcriptional regulator
VQELTTTWELSTRGPARRVYELTSDGRDLLEAWSITLDQNRTILSRFLERYAGLDAEPAPRDRTPLNLR